MTNSITFTLIVAMFTFTACTNHDNSDSTEQKDPSVKTQTSHDMKNQISIVEIPTADFGRATTFYQAILNIKLEVVEMEGIKMALFPGEPEGVAVQLIHGGDYKPSNNGTIVYLNGGDDLQRVANKIKANGGTIIIPKTEIGPDMGFYAMFMDTEGNKLGLHSMN
jgi:predicted enzyme related to lactoylglutathione lyase